MAQGLVSQPLHQHAQKSRHHHRNQQGRYNGQPGDRHGKKADIGTNHINITVGEIYQLDDTINHSIAQRNQCINTAQGDTIYQLLDKLMRKFHKNSSAKLN